MNWLKRIGLWAVYAAGALGIGYLALYAYVRLMTPELRPGDPIRIFRKPDAPSYSRAPEFLKPVRQAVAATLR